MAYVLPSRRLSRSKAARQLVEALESRTMLTATVTPVTPATGLIALSSTVDKDGHLWVASDSVDAAPAGLYEIIDGAVALSVPTEGMVPSSLVAAPNGHLYFVDFMTHNIGEVDPTQPTSAPVMHAVPLGSVDSLVLTVTPGATPGDYAVWFGAYSSVFTGESTPSLRDNYVGRLSASGAISVLPVSQSDSTQLVAIASRGVDAVALGFEGIDDPALQGPNKVGFASLGTGGLQVDDLFAVETTPFNSTETDADAVNFLTSIAVANDGSVWFNLAQTSSTTTRVQAPDRLVQAVWDPTAHTLAQTAIGIDGNSAVLGVGNLAFDGNGRLWFTEVENNSVGLYDTFTSQFTITSDLPAGTMDPVNGGITTLAVNPQVGATDAWVTSTTGPAPLVHVAIDLADVPPAFTVEHAVTGFSATEDAPITDIALVTFSGPDGNYGYTITWGDGTTTTGVAASIGGGMYQVMAGSKIYQTQGVFNGTVAITDLDQQLHSVAFQATISDTPLTITSFTVNKLAARVVVMNMTFTDDVDSKSSWFTASVNWGDGKTSGAVVVKDPTTPGQYLVFGVHAYRTRGMYQVQATITTSEQNVLTPSVTTSLYSITV